MRDGIATGLAALILLAGCSAAERRADDVSNAMAENMAENVIEMNAMDNAALNATDNGAANLTANATTTNDQVDCAAIRDLASPSDCAAFTAQAKNIEQGLGAFNAPAAMTVRQPTEVRFAVGTIAAASETIESAGGAIYKTIRVPTKIGRYMTATLGGPGFKIENQGPAQRDLGASRSEVWIWDVTPQRKGKLNLQLEVSVEAANAQGQRTRITLSRKIVPVEVAVSKADSIREQAEQSARDADLAAKVSKAWASFFTNLALAITAIGALIGAIWYFKIRKPGDPAPPQTPPKDQPGGKP
jgi:hypothetical protein